MKKILLDELDWTLDIADVSAVPPTLRGRSIPATVPGCIHTDLLAAGLIEEPYHSRNELDLTWTGRVDWRYRCEFVLPEGFIEDDAAQTLTLEGVDCLGRVTLNGQVIGACANMHHRHDLNAAPALQAGLNRLEVDLAAPLTHAEAERDRLGALPHVETHPFNFIRKMACNFGWDWGPALITSGLSQSVTLTCWRQARIEAVRPLVERADEEAAILAVHLDLEHARGSRQRVDAELRLTAPDGQEVARARLECTPGAEDPPSIQLRVDAPSLWWPRGYGDPALYQLSVTLWSEAGVTLDRWRGRVGLRSVTLDTAADADGSRFVLRVNDHAVFCKGANWIPDDCFPHRVTPQRYRARIQQAVDANMNMLRVWGGGIFERADFYDVCDELGVMVWQDFLFACAMYPEAPDFHALVEEEARQNVRRLCRHPSLVIWSGCNENFWGYEDWGDWKQEVGDRPWGRGYYLEMLPRILAALDPSRPYWPGSPYSGEGIHPLDEGHGTQHVWVPCKERDYVTYREHSARFVAEFGHIAPATWATLREALDAPDLTPDSPALLHHLKAHEDAWSLRARLEEHFDVPHDFDEWLYLMQLNQARAVTLGVEWFRSLSPRCSGVLYWQLNDCWPAISWAAIDVAGRPKPLWFASRRFFADRLLTFQPRPEGGLALFAINDSGQPWRETLSVCRVDFDGQVRARLTHSLNLSPRAAGRVDLDAALATPDDARGELLVAREGSLRACWFFERDRHLNYPPPRFDATLECSQRGDVFHHVLSITARTLIRDLAVFPDRLDATASVDEQLVTLLPGETSWINITARRPLDRVALTTAPVCRCVNPFGALRDDP